MESQEIWQKSKADDPIKEFVSPIIYEFNGVLQSIGTLTIIAPGLAITAKHVIEHHLQEHNIDVTQRTHASPFRLLTYQLLPNGNYASWFIVNCFLSQHTDIAILRLESANQTALDILTQMSTGDERKLMRMTLNPPDISSKIYGFGYPTTTIEVIDGVPQFNLNSHTTGGVVSEVYMEKLDSVMKPFPVVESNARFDGGMSGGPVFNEAGELVGVISTGLDDADGMTHTGYASLLWPILGTEIIFNRADHPDLNNKGYLLLELAKEGHISVNGWRNIAISTDGNQKTVTYRTKKS
jgi:S1-C subfamily serine protease